jgi:hypothetical protein
LFAFICKMLNATVAPEPPSCDTNERNSESMKTLTIPVINIRLLPFPHAEQLLVFTSGYICAWGFWFLSMGLTLSIACGTELGFDVFVIAVFLWFSPSFLTIDLRNWRVVVTVPNAIIVANACVNAWAVIQAALANSLSRVTTVSSVICFALLPCGFALSPIMDHDLYGFYVKAPVATGIFMTVLVKFYARGIFVGNFFNTDASFSVWKFKFSSVVLITNSLLQILALAVRLVVFARSSRAGDPHRILGTQGVASVQYRKFPIDDVLDSRWHVRGLVAMHLIGGIAAVIGIACSAE